MARAGRQSTSGDMVRSLLVILVPVVIIVIIFTRTPSEPPVRVVDWQPAVSTARAQAGFGVYAPTSLPDGWRVTKAEWVKKGDRDAAGNVAPAGTWRFGVLSPQNVYLAIDQQQDATPDFVAAATKNGVGDGQSSVRGTDWARTVSADQRTRSLIHRERSDTAVVSGDTDYLVLDSFVELLTTR